MHNNRAKRKTEEHPKSTYLCSEWFPDSANTLLALVSQDFKWGTEYSEGIGRLQPRET